MTKHRLGRRLAWLARILLLGGIVLLAARVDVPTWRAGESSVSDRLIVLVRCVLPATAADPSAAPAGAEDSMTPECDASVHDRRDGVWMTPC